MEWNDIFHWHFVLMKVCFSSFLTAPSFQNTYTHIHVLLLKEEILPEYSSRISSQQKSEWD